jgi:hypothetical protein
VGAARTTGGWLAELPPARGPRLLAGARPTPAEERALQDDVVAAFPEYRLAVYFAERPGVFAHADHVVVARGPEGDEGTGGPATDRLVGLLVARWRQGRVGRYLHVEMNLIATDHQRRGVLGALWRVMLTRLLDEPGGLPDVVAIKTYNPMVYSSLALVARLTGATLYPALDPAATGAELRTLAASVAADLAGHCPFDPATGVLTGASVPPDFYPALPTTNKRDVQGYFVRHVRPGDRLLCVLQLGDARVDPVLRRFGVRQPTAAARES